MEFRILGPLEVVDGTTPVPLGGRKQRALIARLVLDANRTVAVDRLVDDLWGDDVPDTAVKMVQIAVSRLRKVLPGGVLVTRPPGYALEVDPDAIDLVRFTRLRGEGRAALAAGDVALAADRGREALALWRGPALAEFPEPFAESEAAHLEELRLTCLADRIEADLALGRHTDVVAELETLVARHPLRERVLGQQMLALHRSGRQPEALEAFQRFRRKLDEELGLVPSAELQELHDRILRQDPGLAVAEGRAAAAPEARERAAAEAGDSQVRSGAAADAPDAAAEARGGAERRRLTILVAELPPDSLRGLDPEEAHGRVGAFQRTAGEVVADLGGHAAQQLGAALVAYFGWPRAHEDGPLRAVRAALRIAEETGARAGVDTGMAVVGEERFGAVGETVADAQALAEGTAPGAVRIGAATERLVRGWIDAVPDADGAFAAAGETGVRSTLELAQARGLTPLVGREPELHLLHERWGRAAAGAGQVVFLSGEPGVGKSRLVEALADRIAADRPATVTFRCFADRQATALHPVYDALGLPPEADKDRRIAAVADMLAQRADAVPLLLVFEDLHWADASTLELLATLVRRAPASSVLVLCTCRPEFRPDPEILGRVTQLSLARLDRAETEEMVAALLGESVSPALIDRIAERTDGVPLFIEEVVRELQESGELDEDAPGVAIPATLQDSLMARLDRLGDAKQVVQTAALLAREFPYALLAEVAEEDEERLLRALDRLVDAGILFAVGQPPGDRYLFKHALLQDAAYDSVLQSTRQELHARVAAVLEEQFDELVEVEPECVARHLTAAGRWVDAIPHWLRAGEHALGTFAYAEAAAHLHAGLRLIPQLPDDEARREAELTFQLRLGAARMASNGYAAPRTVAAFERAEELSSSLDDSARLAPALNGVAAFNVATGQQRRAYGLAQRLLRIAEAGDVPGILVDAEALLGTAAVLLGRLDDAREHLDRAVEAWDPDAHRHHTLSFGQEPGVIALSMRAQTLGWLGDVTGARQSSARAVDAAREVAHPHTLAYALGAAGVLALGFGDVDRAAAVAGELVPLAAKHRLSTWHAWGRVFDGWVSLRRGDVERGMAEATAGIDAASAAGFLTTRAHFVASLADGCVRAGAAQPALEMVDEALERVGPEGEVIYEPEMHRVRGAALLAADDRSPEAEAELHRALAGARDLGARLPELRAAHTLADLLAARGRAEEARTVLGEALAAFGETEGAPVAVEAAQAHEGLVARA